MLLFFIFGSTMSSIISHAGQAGVQDLSRLVGARIEALAHNATLQALAHEFAAFPLGCSLLGNKGLNGPWTKYLIRTTASINPQESRLLQVPSVRATRERFDIFQKQQQRFVKPGAMVASIPCGVMDDWLSCPNLPEGVSLIGVDADQASLEIVRSSSSGRNIDLRRGDAWDLQMAVECDVITSNGLNIYEEDDARVTELYKNFFRALKPGGILITSFLTPPNSGWLPGGLEESVWKGELAWQKMVFTEVLGVNWQHFRAAETTRGQLEAAGFTNIEFTYDKQRIFPTVVAQRPEVEPDKIQT